MTDLPDTALDDELQERPAVARPSINATLTVLRKLFPAAFYVPRPLKLGIYHDILERTEIDKVSLKRAMALYCSGRPYLNTMIEGASRIDLDGEPAGVVDANGASNAAFRAERVTRIRKERREEAKRRKSEQLIATTPTSSVAEPPPNSFVVERRSRRRLAQ